MNQKRFPFILAVGFWIAACILAISFGAVEDASVDLIIQLRLPRVILASAIGLGLSIAGAGLQSLFSNPLCDPYTLGISSGSALGAVLGASIGSQWMVAGHTGTAFVGAILFASILYIISVKSKYGNSTLLLAGVMLGFLGNSLVALWIVLADSNGLQGVLNWLFGDLSRARMDGAMFSGIAITILSVMIWMRSNELDALLMGEEAASALGVEVRKVRGRLILLTSLLIGLCVSAGGMIGFIGLVVPHFTRRLYGALHFRMIPLCAIWGATILTIADCVSRVVARPYELPVGVVTALMGAPVFLWMILQRRNEV